MSTKRGSLRTQLIFWNALAILLMLVGFGFVVRYMVTNTLLQSVNQALEHQIGPLPMGMPHPRGGPGGPGRDGPPGPPPDLDMRRPPDRNNDDSETELSLVPRHFDLQGNPMGVRKLLSRAAFDAVLQGSHKDLRRIEVEEEPYQILTIPIYRDGTLSGVGQVGYRLTELEAAIQRLDNVFLLLLPVGVLVAVVGSTLLTRHMLGRIHRVSQAASRLIEQVDQGEMQSVSGLPVQGNDEFSELSTVLNTLLNKQQTAYIEQQRVLEQERRFTGDASHELQSPLTVIKGVTSMVLETTPPLSPEQQKECFVRVDRATDTMIQMVQDLLLLARSDSQQLGQDRVEVLISEILARAMQYFTQEEVPIQIEITDPTLSIVGNETELVRLFTNLLSNAQRFTPKGKITVVAQREDEWVRIEVQDTGIGIAPEHLPHLGERFYRVDASRTRSRGGTGLGLSICKSIVSANGGKLEIASKPGEGTTVSVWLPSSD